ncbi:hypothetical protein ACFORO_10450 [Amycolatopsis halotolerans]|uniref:Uncharacterized protein n=1 Tax=Amycolatopsis halotolerans TaxID=330083 RepID=A0ABV7QB59_9PSEU
MPVAELAGHVVERHAGAGARWSAERLIDLSHLLLEVSLVDPCGACDGARAVRLLPGDCVAFQVVRTHEPSCPALPPGARERARRGEVVFDVPGENPGW